MTILVVGARGTIGGYFAALRHEFDEPLELIGRAELDIADANSVHGFFSSRRYRTIINLAAVTDLDRAEVNPNWAHRSNAEGPLNLANAAAATGAVMVQLSTVGIFGADGAMGPFSELDPPNPCNVYARTKLEGEVQVRRILQRAFIVRTAWVMGGGRNDKKFVGKVYDKLRNDEPLRVVNDKVGSPTYALDLVRCIRALLATEAFGVYHVTNGGAASRFDIVRRIKSVVGSRSEIAPVSSAEFPLAAARPPSEVSVSSALASCGLGGAMSSWEDALDRYLSSEIEPPVEVNDSTRTVALGG